MLGSVLYDYVSLTGNLRSKRWFLFLYHSPTYTNRNNQIESFAPRSYRQSEVQRVLHSHDRRTVQRHHRRLQGEGKVLIQSADQLQGASRNVVTILALHWNSNPEPFQKSASKFEQPLASVIDRDTIQVDKIYEKMTGLRAAFEAYRKVETETSAKLLPGFEYMSQQQLFFLSYAEVSIYAILRVRALTITRRCWIISTHCFVTW